MCPLMESGTLSRQTGLAEIGLVFELAQETQIAGGNVLNLLTLPAPLVHAAKTTTAIMQVSWLQKWLLHES